MSVLVYRWFYLNMVTYNKRCYLQKLKVTYRDAYGQENRNKNTPGLYHNTYLDYFIMIIEA